MTPRILAQASLPSICSFSNSSPPPELTITLTLQSAPSAIALHNRFSPFFPLMNAIRIRDAVTLETIQTPRMDVFRRHTFANETRKENYWMLEPDVPFVLMRLNFRPYGDLILKRMDWEQRKALGSERWRMCVTLGMQSLEPGREYVVGICEGLEVYNWRVVADMDDDEEEEEKGDVNRVVTENIHAAAEKSGRIPVDVAEGCRFRVEE